MNEMNDRLYYLINRDCECGLFSVGFQSRARSLNQLN